jgi:hypothetical protein
MREAVPARGKLLRHERGVDVFDVKNVASSISARNPPSYVGTAPSIKSVSLANLLCYVDVLPIAKEFVYLHAL